MDFAGYIEVGESVKDPQKYYKTMLKYFKFTGSDD